jgi:EmrB/QacA subfamily drug resistance transporter
MRHHDSPPAADARAADTAVTTSDPPLPSATGDRTSFLATGRGKLVLALLCLVAFLDFVDASIVNIALPSIRGSLHFSNQSLQWVPSGYLLTYGGLMLLGGRAADLLGRRRVLVAGTIVFAGASLTGGFAGSAGVLVGARLAQGVGAAFMLPAALSLLTTLFREGKDRTTALGVWGGVAGLASAVGVFLGGVLSEGPGWRWVLFVNPPVCVLVLAGAYWLLPGERRRAALAAFDALGAVLCCAGLLLLVYGLVEAPTVGWGTARTVGSLAGSVVLLVAFLWNETRAASPLLPLRVFRVRGLAAANGTYFIAVAGFISMFFFLTLYMQNVLRYSQIRTGSAYLPLCVGVGMAAGMTARLISRVGTRALISVGSLVAGAGLFMLSRIPVDGAYVTNLLPGLMIASFGLGAVFVAVATAANADVPPDLAGVAAALLNTAQQIGGAFGLAVFSALATARTNHLMRSGASAPHALAAGFQRALLGGAIATLVAAVLALRTTNTHEDAMTAGAP